MNKKEAAAHSTKTTCNSLFYIIKADDRSEQIEHVVQIDSLPDVELVFRFGQIVEQKLQDQGAAKGRGPRS